MQRIRLEKELKVIASLNQIFSDIQNHACQFWEKSLSFPVIQFFRILQFSSKD